MPDPSEPSPLSKQGSIDRLADRFEAEFKAGKRPEIEAYLQGDPDLNNALLSELLKLELELRRDLGEQPAAQEYRLRFHHSDHGHVWTPLSRSS